MTRAEPTRDRALSRAVSLALAAFVAALRLLPRHHRHRFGEDLVEAFHDEASAAWRERGAFALLRQTQLAVADLLRVAIRERLPVLHDPVAELRCPPPDRSDPRASLMDTLSQDLRFAFRTLRASPGFTLAVVGTLALGIGVNTTIFTLVDAIVLRPLPFPDSERVVILCEVNERLGDFCVASATNVRDLAASSEKLATAGVARNWTFSHRDDDGTSSLRAGIATPGFLQVHGLVPALGRLLVKEDLEPGREQVVVLTHRFWQGRFGGDPGVLGQSLELDGRPFEVVGVLPPAAWLYASASIELWAPLTATPEDTGLRGWRGFVALARLADGATLTQARDELEGLRAGLEQQYPEDNAGWGLRLERLRDTVAGPTRPLLLLFAGAVGLVLLIACVNVANLMLVRATGRAPEIAVRASLGAGRRRIVRQLLTESVVLALGGAAVGLAVATGLTRVFLTMAPTGIPRLSEVAVDPRALGFCLLLAAGTAVAFGLVPAWRASHVGLTEALRSGRHGDPRVAGLRRALVVAEMALASMLLVGAGLMTRGFSGLLDWQPGFDRDQLITTWALADFAKFDDGQQIVEAFDHGARTIEALPGVDAVGQTSAGPLFGGLETDHFEIVGRSPMPADDRPSARWYDIGPGYFDALGIGLERGRDFTDHDDAAGVPVVIINATMARTHWPDGDPIGDRLRVKDRTMEIVGVVADVAPFRPELPIAPEMYWPKRQYPRGATYYLIRSGLAPASLEEQVRARIAETEPGLELSRFVTIDEHAADEIVSPRFNLLVVALFATVAVALSAIGTYGVIAYSVANRAHEVGIRVALGAPPGRIVGGILASGLRLAALGLVLGVTGATLAGRLLSSLLYGVPVTDPLTLALVAAGFIAIALLACAVPAWRASHLDPVRALRAD